MYIAYEYMHSSTSFDQTLYIQYCYFFCVVSQLMAAIKNNKNIFFWEDTNEPYTKPS